MKDAWVQPKRKPGTCGHCRGHVHVGQVLCKKCLSKIGKNMPPKEIKDD